MYRARKCRDTRYLKQVQGRECRDTRYLKQVLGKEMQGYKISETGTGERNAGIQDI